MAGCCRHMQISHQRISSVLLQSHFAPLISLANTVLAVFKELFGISSTNLVFSHFSFPFKSLKHQIPGDSQSWQAPLGPKVDSWGTGPLVFSGMRKLGFSTPYSGRFWCSSRELGPPLEWHDLGISACTIVYQDCH